MVKGKNYPTHKTLERLIMNETLLQGAIVSFVTKIEEDRHGFDKGRTEIKKILTDFQSWTEDKLLHLSEKEFSQLLQSLWASDIWENKPDIINRIILVNSMKDLRTLLAFLIWGKENIAFRWDRFKLTIKGFSGYMMSEMLCKIRPMEYIIWNSNTAFALRYLHCDPIPKRDMDIEGKLYEQLCHIEGHIGKALEKNGIHSVDYLLVHHFLQITLPERNHHPYAYQISLEPSTIENSTLTYPPFFHQEIRDKIKEIGEWLGYLSEVEKKVSNGSVVDVLWEASIGNIGRAIYVFEVQTKGDVNSLLLNLLKSLKNPAVQGVIAVSDQAQLEKIKKHAVDITELKQKVKFWDYENVLEVHQSLQFVSRSMKSLNLVSKGFF